MSHLRTTFRPLLDNHWATIEPPLDHLRAFTRPLPELKLLCFFNIYIYIYIGLSTFLPPVVSNFYFLPTVLHFFFSQMVLVLLEKTEIVPPSNFLSKTNGLPCHPTCVDVILQHLSPCHLILQTTTTSDAPLPPHLINFKREIKF